MGSEPSPDAGVSMDTPFDVTNVVVVDTVTAPEPVSGVVVEPVTGVVEDPVRGAVAAVAGSGTGKGAGTSMRGAPGVTSFPTTSDCGADAGTVKPFLTVLRSVSVSPGTVVSPFVAVGEVS